MAAEAGVQEATVWRSSYPIQQARTGQPVAEHKATATRLHRRSSRLLERVCGRPIFKWA